jgi:hypothetical protein
MLLAGLFAVMLAAPTTELMIPEGTILPVVLNETLNTSKVQDNDPILLSLADDIRAAGHRGPVLVPRGSSVVGRIARSQRAGHFIGRSEMNIAIQEIITPTGQVYDGVSTKIIDIAKKKGEKGELKADGGIQGPVHRERDAFLLLFPPTTLFQLIATPKRGPDIILPVETRLYVKLMTPIYVETLQQPQRLSEVLPAVPTVQPIPAAQPFVPQATQPFVTQTAAYTGPQPVPTVSSNGVEILVAPVALYPDAILRDLFIACLHPIEIIQANQWVHQYRDASGSLPREGYNENWDPSVKALTAYPDLLQRLSADTDWMRRLATVYSGQSADVMTAVRQVRLQANSIRSSSGVTAMASGR